MENITPNEEPPVSTEKKKKKHTGLIILIVIIVIAVYLGCCTGYYLYQRKQPAQTVEHFLDSVKKMDFDTMESLLQSNDLSALDNTVVNDEIYFDFFKKINEKMTYKIIKNNFSPQSGTASVTAHITYIDGTPIYKAAVSEFLRQMVSNAFSEESPSTESDNAEVTHKKLASILYKAANENKSDKFSETDITYPLIKTDSGWKIVSLDEATVRIMSADCLNMEDEINNSIDGESDTASTSDSDTDQENQILDLETDNFSIKYTKHSVTKDFAGNPCIMVYYDYTNKSSSPSSAMVDVNLSAYQHGDSCEAAIPEKNDDAIDRFTAEIKPGQTVNVCQAFTLTDESDVTIQAQESFSFSGNESVSQVLKVK